MSLIEKELSTTQNPSFNVPQHVVDEILSKECLRLQKKLESHIRATVELIEGTFGTEKEWLEFAEKRISRLSFENGVTQYRMDCVNQENEGVLLLVTNEKEHSFLNKLGGKEHWSILNF